MRTSKAASISANRDSELHGGYHCTEKDPTDVQECLTL